jgi:GT2 family glycosyltransferase
MPNLFTDQLSEISQNRDLANSLALHIPAAEEPLVSIIIPIHNQFGYTVRCLASIQKHSNSIAYEVIIMDDASDLAVFRALSSVAGLRIVRNFKNLGFVHSCNRGVYHARGTYVLLLNNDTEVTAGWIEALVQVFQTKPDAGLVGAKLVYPDGHLQEAGGIVWRDASAWNYGRNDDPDLPWYNFLRETDYCSGACIMLPRALWGRLGGFDHRYAPAYYEDVDLAFRVRDAGFKVYYQPHCSVVHHEGKSNGIDTGQGIKHHQVVNQKLFYDSWQGALATHLPNAEQVFRARDRSINKKTILFIDHYVPHIDQDAGSRNIFCYLKLFLHYGFNVKFIGDNFYPHQPYQDILEELGIEVLTGAHMLNNWQKWLEQNGQYLDYVLLNRAHTAARWLEPLRQHTKAPLLFCGCDLISRTLRRAYDQYGDPKHLEESLSWIEKENFVISRVDHVYYPSAEEVKALRLAYPGKQIEMAPLYFLPPKPGFVSRPPKERANLLFVCSFAHPPNVDALRWFIADVFPKVQSQHHGIRLNVVGRNPPKELMDPAPDGVDFRGFVSDETLAGLYQCCRISVVPLRIGGGIKGKILEAFYNGIAVVTTRIGIEGIPATEEHCEIVSDLDQFAAKLSALYGDEERLQRYYSQSYDMVIREYSIETLAKVFSAAVPELRT